MQKVILTLLFLFFICSFSAQDSLVFKTSFPTKATDFQVDNLGYIYTFNADYINKLNSEGSIVSTYSNNRLGAISKIDVTNPLKILVLHKNQNKLVVLDNMLSPERNNSLNLTTADLYNTSAFCYSTIDNGVWFYDIELFQLIKINTAMQRIYASGNLLQLLNLKELEVTEVVESSDKLYLITSNTILVFDLYGAYYTTVFFPNSNNVSVERSLLISFDEGILKAYDSKTFEENSFTTALNPKGKVIVKNNVVYQLAEGKIAVYKFL